MGDVPIKYACSAPKCGASTKNMIQLFSFPSHKDPNRLKWCRKFRTLRNDRKWTPGFCDRVCMAHFANECFALGTEYYDKVCRAHTLISQEKIICSSITFARKNYYDVSNRKVIKDFG